MAAALGWWWLLRGRLAAQDALLREAAGRVKAGSDGWCAVQLWVGLAALFSSDLAGTLDAFTGLRDAAAGRGPCRALADGLMGRAAALANIGQAAEAAGDARRALAVAREIGYRTGEILALGTLSVAVQAADDLVGAVQMARQAAQITAGVPGSCARWSSYVLTSALIAAGDLDAAAGVCATGLARSRDAGDVQNQVGLLPQMVRLDLHAGRVEDAAAHLRDGLQIAVQTGSWLEFFNYLEGCSYLCAATGRPAEAMTIWTACATLSQQEGYADSPEWARRRDEHLHSLRQKLGPGRLRTAEERGAEMSTATAAEYALMLTAPGRRPQEAPPGLARLSARERELVTLVARGRTDAQIAEQLYISVRTVRSHLDRIRDKTGCRRRADLTRIALQAHLV